MENQECKDGGKRCGCCFGKVVMIILVFLVGGILGYLKGQNCCMHKACGMHMMPPPMDMGAAPPPPAKAK